MAVYVYIRENAFHKRESIYVVTYINVTFGVVVFKKKMKSVWSFTMWDNCIFLLLQVLRTPGRLSSCSNGLITSVYTINLVYTVYRR